MRAPTLSVGEPIETLIVNVLLRGRSRLPKTGYWGNGFKEHFLSPNLPAFSISGLAAIRNTLHVHIFLARVFCSTKAHSNMAMTEGTETVRQNTSFFPQVTVQSVTCGCSITF